jgi:hypothetical protein
MKKYLLIVLTMSVAIGIHAQTASAEDTLKQYTGKYKFPEGGDVTEIIITLDSGRLNASSVQGSSELRWTHGDEFEVVAYGGTATFKRNDKNKIVGLHILVGDLDIEGVKDETAIARYYIMDLKRERLKSLLFNMGYLKLDFA